MLTVFQVLKGGGASEVSSLRKERHGCKMMLGGAGDEKERY